MDPHSAVDKAKAYLQAELATAESNRRVALGPFITISRESGAGGSTLATELARRLNRLLPLDQQHWDVFGRNLVETMLEQHRLPPTLSRFLPEDKVSEIDSSVGEILGLHPSIWTLVHQTNTTIRRLAGMGRVIVVGRGANFATAGLGHGLHLRLVGSPEARARRVAVARGIAHEQALAFNRKTDAARRDYVRGFFDTEIDNADAYDLVINTDRSPAGDCAALVLTLLQARREIDPPPSPTRSASPAT